VPKKKTRSSKHSTRRSGHPARRPSEQPSDDWDLLNEAEFALAQNHPLLMLGTASALLDLLDRRNDDPFDRAPKPERVPVADLLCTLATQCITGRDSYGLDCSPAEWRRAAPDACGA
jgi:hypothetical protein